MSYFHLFISLIECGWFNHVSGIVLCPGQWERSDLKKVSAEVDKYVRSDPRVGDRNTYFPSRIHYLMAADDSLDAFSVPKGKLLNPMTLDMNGL